MDTNSNTNQQMDIMPANDALHTESTFEFEKTSIIGAKKHVSFKTTVI